MATRDHGGRLDSAMAEFGGTPDMWLDLSTGIAPDSYPLPAMPARAWTTLPDQAAHDAFVAAARTFWRVPEGWGILPVPGASAAIARIPALATPGRVAIPAPTYNEHAAAFAAQGWTVIQAGAAEAQVCVHPNNPDGRLWTAAEIGKSLSIIDESFADVATDLSLLAHVPPDSKTLILKSFGKFWGLAGLRLGAVIGPPGLINRLSDLLGPWPVSGPALAIGAAALADTSWASAQRQRLATAAARLDQTMKKTEHTLIGGTTLFRLYKVPDAQAIYHRLARAHILTRTFPYDPTWLRVGLPPADRWAQLERAL